MKKVDFLLYYEHWQRELFGLSLLKYELEKEGYTVALSSAPIYKSEDYVGYFLDPEVIVYPWYYRDRNVISAHAFSDKPKKIINMQAEQIFSEWSMSSGFFYTKKEALGAFHVSWTEEQTDRFLNSGVEENNIITSGSINYDINNEIFKSMFKSRDEMAKELDVDVDKEWIVFFANFTTIGRSDEEMMELETKLPGSYEYREIVIEVKSKIMDWFKTYLPKNQDKVIIYKAHPNELIDSELVMLAKELPNFYYIKEYNITEWISVCDKILTWSSTSLVDAIYQNKTCAVLRPTNIQDKYLMNFSGEIYSIENFLELDDFLNNKKDKWKYMKKNGALKNSFYNKVGTFSSKKLAKEAIRVYHLDEFSKCDVSLCDAYRKSYSEYDSKQHFFKYSKLVHDNLTKNIPLEDIPLLVRETVYTKRKEIEIYNMIKEILD